MMQQAATTTADHGAEQLTEAIGRLQVHDQRCLLYETREEQFAATVPFIRLGLERGEKCLYIAGENTAAVVLAALEAGGIDTAAALHPGRHPHPPSGHPWREGLQKILFRLSGRVARHGGSSTGGRVLQRLIGEDINLTWLPGA